MKEIYIKANVAIIPFSSRSVLCTSGTITIEQKTNIKKYGCPIKQGVDCPDYDKHMNEYEQWLNELAKRRDNAIFNQGLDEGHCPHKRTCGIYLECENQQKTR